MSNDFINNIAKMSDLETAEAESLLAAFNDILRTHSLQLDSVAIPAFGCFEPQKHEETIVTDHETGKRLLLPPEIVLTFKSSSSLRKRVVQ